MCIYSGRWALQAKLISFSLYVMYILTFWFIIVTGTITGTGRWKVSAKIQQLLNTLKRPKRRPLPEFYEDDDIELEMAAKNKDPNAPKPEGSVMSPALGEQLVVRRQKIYLDLFFLWIWYCFSFNKEFLFDFVRK